MMAVMNSGSDSGVGLGRRDVARIVDALPDSLALAEVIRDAAGVVVDFRYVYANAAAELRPPGRLVGRTVRETVPPELLSETLELYSRALSAADSELVWMSYRADDGAVIGASVQAFGFDEGRITVSWRDISRKEQAEEEAPQWSEIFDRAAWGVALVSGGRIQRLNRAYAAMHGYSEGELIGAPSEQMFSERSWVPVPEQLERARLLGGATLQAEHVRKDGTAFPVEVDVAIAVDETGRERYRIVQVKDITERVRIERELAEKEAQLSAAMSGRLDAFAILDAVRDDGGRIVDFVYEFVNDAACRESRRSREETVGHGILEILPGHRENGLFERYVRVVETGEPVDVDGLMYEETWGDGQRAVRTFDLRVVRLGDGIAIGFRDVGERRRLRDLLSASEERYRRAVGALSEGILIQDGGGAIVSCNPAAERILGLSVDQMMGVTAVDPRWQAVHEDGSPFPGEEHPAMVMLRTRTPQENVIMGVHKPDGSLSWISMNSMPFRAGGDGAGEDAVVTTFIDITARRSVEARLSESEERFHVAVRAMQDAVAIVSPVHNESGEIVDFRYDYANDAHCELVARDREQLLGRRLGKVFSDWVPSVRFEVYRQVALTGTPFRTEDFHPERAWGTEFARRALDSVVVRAGKQLVVSARDVTDRRRAEAQLRASEERFDAAVGSMLDAFAILSPVRDERGGIVDFRWEYVNDAYCALVGFDRVQLIGHCLVERLSEFPTSARFAVYRLVVETGEPCLSVDVAEPEAWAGGRMASRALDTMIVAAGENVVVTARDVTERHRLEEQLRASEELFRTGVGSLLDGFAILSPVRDEAGEIVDFRWEYANDAHCEVVGRDREQLLTRRCGEVLPGYTGSDVFKLHRRVAQTGKPADVEWPREWSTGLPVDHTYGGSVLPLGSNIIISGRDVTEARRNERELRLRAELLDLAHDAVIVRDPVESRISYWNREAEVVYGYSAAEAIGQVAHDLLQTVFPQSREPVDQALTRDGLWRGDLRHSRKDGTELVIASRQALHRDEHGVPTAIIELNSDVTAQREIERANERLAAVVQSTHDAVVATRRDETIVEWNRGAQDLYGYTAEEAIGQPASMLSAAELAGNDAEVLRRVGAGESVDQYETIRIRKDGVRVPVALTISPILDETGQVTVMAQIARDISDRKRHENELAYLADHDSLTGLFNRRRFQEELERELDRAQRSRTGGALVMIDLDHFKSINDTHGHDVGDEVIARAGEVLQAQLRTTDVLARLGGDEFAALLRGADAHAAQRIAAGLLEATRTACVIDTPTGPQRITASIGVAPFASSGQPAADELLVMADIAMYDAKEAGRDRAMTYDKARQRHERMESGLGWAERIRHALEHDGFVLHAQSIFGLESDPLPRHELLIRMRADDGTLIAPGSFLFIAERMHLITQIDRWVLRQAIQTLAHAQHTGSDIRLHVNLSAQSISDPDLPDLIAAGLKAANADGRGLCLEITETTAITNLKQATRFAAQTANLGCELALDDFGAGYASFYYLKHVPFDYLKIDGEFIQNITHNPTDPLVVQTLANIAKTLGKSTVAEYVGNHETIQLLRTYGVDYAQGFYLGKPEALEHASLTTTRAIPR